jgi:YebC/PmpR family DNA-binding regulatory protein
LAGHSKWKQIKRKKAITDAKRGAHFTKLIREITVAARSGGGAPEMNPRLRLAVDTAKAANMPQENIERAIKKGTGELEGVNYEEINYEGYGPGGVALFIECLTDNGNRSVAEVRNILEKHGGNLGSAGSVAWQFDRKGQIYVDAARYTEDAVLEAALIAGADDVKREDTSFIITTEVVDFHQVQEGLRAAGLEIEDADLSMIPKNEVDVSAKDAEKLLRLIDVLEDHDDVQKVHSNGNIDEKILAEAAAAL